MEGNLLRFARARVHVHALMTQTSYAVGMRNAILRNYLKVSRKVGCVLTYNEVHFVSLADNLTVQLSNFLTLLSGMENKAA